MQTTFLGVGEACDPQLLNTSLLMWAGPKGDTCILLDCGFTAAHRFFAHIEDPDDLDALWISHFHGDHFFGVPLLLLRLWEMQRRSPLIILGPSGVEEIVGQAMDLAYPNVRSKMQYPLDFREVGPSDVLELLGGQWHFARTEHPRENLALRLGFGGKALYYSGDGQPSPASRELAAGCQLIVQESYLIEHEVAGHGSVAASLDLAREAGGERLALVHMQRDERRRYARIFQAEVEKTPDLGLLLPLPDDSVDIE
jgi:ribonuclease BN (tRNA processing enzyme)